MKTLKNITEARTNNAGSQEVRIQAIVNTKLILFRALD
jgi:hypothetical protein